MLIHRFKLLFIDINMLLNLVATKSYSKSFLLIFKKMTNKIHHKQSKFIPTSALPTLTTKHSPPSLNLKLDVSYTSSSWRTRLDSCARMTLKPIHQNLDSSSTKPTTPAGGHKANFVSNHTKVELLSKPFLPSATITLLGFTI